MKLNDFSKTLYHISDEVIFELIESLNHIDDILVFTYIKAFSLIRCKFLLLKVCHSSSLYELLLQNYKSILFKDVQHTFNIAYEELKDAIIEYFEIACNLIEQIYNSISINSFYDFDNVNTFDKLIYLINKKNSVNINIDIREYELTLLLCLHVIDDVILDKKLNY